MIAIVDYGLGNIEAIATIYRRLEIPVCVASSAQRIGEADRIVLPGVGAFDRAMTRLNDSGMREALDDASAQWLWSESERLAQFGGSKAG